MVNVYYGPTGQRRWETLSKAILGAWATGMINNRQLEDMAQEYAISGQLPTMTYRGYRFTLTIQSLDCDCGKGFLCPLARQQNI